MIGPIAGASTVGSASGPERIDTLEGTPMSATEAIRAAHAAEVELIIDGADLVLEIGDDARDRGLGQASFPPGAGEAAGAGDAREQLKGGEAIGHLKYKYIIFICSGYCANLR